MSTNGGNGGPFFLEKRTCFDLNIHNSNMWTWSHNCFFLIIGAVVYIICTLDECKVHATSKTHINNTYIYIYVYIQWVLIIYIYTLTYTCVYFQELVFLHHVKPRTKLVEPQVFRTFFCFQIQSDRPRREVPWVWWCQTLVSSKSSPPKQNPPFRAMIWKLSKFEPS